jgi:ATP/maltotriose-dependent transcriptional regulator MalT
MPRPVTLRGPLRLTPAARTRSASADALRAGRDALARGRWATARRQFLAALRRAESSDALEGLALACYWLGAIDEMFRAHERAYQLHRRRGDARSAARLAAWLAWDYQVLRSEGALAAGWIERGLELLQGQEQSSEHGWLVLRDVQFFRIPVHAFAESLERLEQVRARARAAADFDLEMEALALEGVALIGSGRIREGRRRLDHAASAAAAGQIRDENSRGNVLCHVIAACDATCDVDRAGQWCDTLREFADSHDLRPFSLVCRTQVAGLLIRRGAWARAERALAGVSSTWAGLGTSSVVRMAELRRRQGRLDEARRLFERAAQHPLAQIGLAALALERGDPRAASDLVDRRLRALPPDARLERGTALPVAVQARAALGLHARADEAARELRALAKAAGTRGFQALAAHAEGQWALAAGALDRSRHAFEDAMDAAGAAGMPFEAADARLGLARALSALGRAKDARAETREAARELRALGAEARARALERGLAGRDGAGADVPRSRAAAGRRARGGTRGVAARRDGRERRRDLSG